MDLRDLLLLLVTALVLPSAHVAQSSFRLNGASKMVDVGIEVGKAPDKYALPSASYKFYRKGTKKPFQTVAVKQINMWDDQPKANVTLLYDDQSVINFGDFNFDGVEDVALNDGTKGGYGMPSYVVYLYSQARKRYLFSKPFTRINQNGNLGFMEIDRKNRRLYRYTKSGCCWHQTEGYDVFRGRPRKIYEFTEEAARGDGFVRITTSKLIRGRWRTWEKKAKESEYYKQ